MLEDHAAVLGLRLLVGVGAGDVADGEDLEFAAVPLARHLLDRRHLLCRVAGIGDRDEDHVAVASGKGLARRARARAHYRRVRALDRLRLTETCIDIEVLAAEFGVALRL